MMTHESLVIIVDDDDAVRESLTLLLEAEGLPTRAYSSGRDLLATDELPQRGCLVIDVRMPDIDGLELQVQLLEKGVTLPVIIMTGHGDVPIAVQAMKKGAVDFIEKPFVDEVMLGSIRQALARSQRNQSGSEINAEIRQKIDQLTAREREVLDRLVVGRPNKVIAYELGISPRTVEIHRARVMEKMQAHSLSHLVRMALTAGIDPAER